MGRALGELLSRLPKPLKTMLLRHRAESRPTRTGFAHLKPLLLIGAVAVVAMSSERGLPPSLDHARVAAPSIPPRAAAGANRAPVVQGGTPSYMVTPDGTQSSVTPSTSTSLTFTVNPTQAGTHTYNLTAVCTGAAIVSGCTLSQSSVTLNTWGTNVTVSFTSGAYPTFGTVKVIAVHSTNSSVKDSGWVNITAGNQPWATVTPDGAYGSGNLEPGTPYTMQFMLRNTGNAAGTFTIAPNCAGNGITGCTVSQTSATLNPNAFVYVNLNYTHGLPSSSGMAGVKATWNGNSAQMDTGYFNFVTGGPAAISVTPDSATIVRGPEDEETFEYYPDWYSAGFSLQNTGGTTGTFNVSVACTGYSPCTPYGTTVTLAPGAQTTSGATVQLNSYDQTGTISLRATQNNNPTVTDSGFVVVRTWSKRVVATPDNQFVNRPVGGQDSLQFTIQNQGSLAATYNVATLCMGTAFAGGMPVCTASQSSVSLNPGASATVWGRYTRGAAGSSGKMQLNVVDWQGSQQFRDTAYYNIGIAASPNVGVNPDGAFSGYLANSLQSEEFVVWNTGNISDTFTIEVICSGEGFSVGCTTTSPTTVTLGAGNAHYLNVDYGVGEPGTSGKILVKATSHFDPTKTDSGWFNTSSPAAPVPKFTVTPDGASRILPANTLLDLTFTINLNTGYQYTTFSVACSGNAFAQCPSPYNWAINAGTMTWTGAYTTAATPGTGRVTFTAQSGSVVDIGWVDVSTFAATGPAIVVSPDGDQRAGIMPNGPRSVSFVLSNTGNATTTYNLTSTCTGAAFVGGCTPSLSAVTLLANKDTTVDVTYQAAGSGTSGRVKLRAVKNTDSAVVDSGWTDVAMIPVAPFSIAPREDSMVVAGGAYFYFTVRNTSPSIINWEGRFVCSGQAFTSSCSSNTSQYAIAPGASIQLSAGAGMGGVGRTGTAKLVGWVVGTPAVSDSGKLHVTVTSSQFVALDIEPDNQVRYVYPGAASSTQFILKNVGTQAGQFSVGATCTGPAFASGCTVTPTGPSLQPTQQYPINVTFTAGPVATTGTIRLIAYQPINPAVADTAWMTVSTGNSGATTVSVLPDNGAQLSQASYSAFQTFYVVNTGNAPGTFTISQACTGVALTGTCSVTPTSVALAVGASAPINMSTATSATNGSTGKMRLTATLSSDPTVKDSGWVNVTLGQGVVVTPDGGSISAPTGELTTVRFTVMNGRTARSTFTLGATCTGAAFSGGCSVLGSGFSLDPGSSATVPVQFVPGTVGQAGIIRISSWASTPGQSAAFDTAWVNLTVTAARVPGVAVTPQNGSKSDLAPGTIVVDTFTVTNNGTKAGDYALSRTCIWAGQPLTPCDVSDASLKLDPGSSKKIMVTHATGAIATSGTTWLKASIIGSALVDSGRYNLATWTVTPGTSINVKIDSVNPGTSMARDQCLTIAAGDDAAYECGDLRIVHELPAIKTMGVNRAPTLLYNSRHARGRALIAASVFVPAAITPAQLEATITISGISRTRTYTWNASWSGGSRRRIVFPIDAVDLALATGRYTYSLQVKGLGGSGNTDPVSDTGTVILVNRSLSQFGEGWWLEGLEQLVSLSATEFLWIGGDGSTRIYTRTGSGVWTVGAQVDRPETINSIPDIGGNQVGYRRRLRNKAYVEFNATYRHVATVNRQQHRTVFTWGPQGASTVLQKITPFAPNTRPPGIEIDYTFTYVDVSGVPILDSIHAPSQTSPSVPRNVKIGRSSRRVTSIRDPGTPVRQVEFYYDASNRLYRRKNRRGDLTVFAFDTAGLVRRVSLDMTRISNPGMADSIVTSFCPAESRSVSACANEPWPVDSNFTRVDGPRTDAADITTFFVNRFGAPWKIVNAVSDSTVLRRHDVTFPALVTGLRQPNGFETFASYDARGLPSMVRASTPYGLGGNDAITVYRWNRDYELVDTMFAAKSHSLPSPSDERTVFTYDAFGNRTSQEDGRGSVSRVTFKYDEYNRVEAIDLPGIAIGPNGQGRERIGYDARLGNVSRDTTPMGFVTTYDTDALGRDSVVTMPIDATGAKKTIDRFAYDVMSRVVHQWTYAPLVNVVFDSLQVQAQAAVAPALVRHVQNAYDAEGNLDSLVRSTELPGGSPQYSSNTTKTTFWYDEAHRKVRDSTDLRFRSLIYDEAGNVKQDQSRLGVITLTYDALNRVLTRVVPGRKTPGGVINSAVTGGLPNQGVGYPYYRLPIAGTGNFLDTLVIFDDTATFAYDQNGNMRRAGNRDALVTRDYFPNGQLKADSLRLARYTYVAAPTAPVYDGPTYVQTYAYDLSGRRSSRFDSGVTCVGCSQTYHYDVAGLLDWTEDEGSLGSGRIRFNFVYDAAGRLKSRYTNGDASNAKVSVGFGYDDDGRMTSRSVVTTSSPSPIVFQDSHVYDARGKKLISSSGGDLWENVYDGFAQLVGTGRLLNGYPAVDINYLDALGNVVKRISDSTLSSSSEKHVDFTYGRDQITTATRPAHRVVPGMVDSSTFHTDYFYDANGNQTQENLVVSRPQLPLPPSGPPTFVPDTIGHSFQWLMHGMDNKLRYAQKTWYGAGMARRTVFTEYRYDALGRRVLARTRRDSSCVVGSNGNTEWDCLSTMDRYVWDGDQLLFEYRVPGGNAVSEEGLQWTVGSGNFHGAVRYTHAGGIDEPLAVWGGGAQNYGVVPHLSWRGTFEAGSDILTGARLESGTPPWIWPNAYKDINLAPELRAPIPDPTRWLGSLIEGQIDFNGLAYRRNRYYSPTTGRFTSEDPIGLAGGLNMYGFADGDPVNVSDPFGLQGCPKGSIEGPGGACFSAPAALGAAITAAVQGVTLPVRSLLALSQRAKIAALADDVSEIHSVLDPIARVRRTTAVLQTDGGKIAAGGARDLTPAQRIAAARVGATPSAAPGVHAEITALRQAQQAGLQPDALAVSRPICPACQAAIRETGGRLTSPTTVKWP